MNDLYGTYLADYETGREELTLNSDNTFSQEVTIKATSKVDVSHGTWNYNSKSGYVRFEAGFMSVLTLGKFNADYRNPNSGVVAKPAEKVLGRLRIGTTEGIIYEKKRSR